MFKTKSILSLLRLPVSHMTSGILLLGMLVSRSFTSYLFVGLIENAQEPSSKDARTPVETAP
jgi:hypothetical protein